MEYLPTFADQLDSDYISHHGIKGMKWGVRRYQNLDGSYTSAGKVKRKISGKNKLSNDQKTLMKVMLGSALTASVAAGIGSAYVANKDAEEYFDVFSSPGTQKFIVKAQAKASLYQELATDKYSLSSIHRDKLKEMRESLDRDIKTAKETADVSRSAYNRLSNNTSLKLAMKVSKKTRAKMEQARQAVYDIENASDMMSMYGKIVRRKITIAEDKERIYNAPEKHRKALAERDRQQRELREKQKEQTRERLLKEHQERLREDAIAERKQKEYEEWARVYNR